MTKRGRESKSVERHEESIEKLRHVTDDDIGLRAFHGSVELNGADPKSLMEYEH